jgi:hypothetical protein
MRESNFNVKSKKEKVKELSQRSFFFAFLFFTFYLPGSAQSDGSQQNKTGRAGVFAITNARIVTVSGAVIENGTVLIQDGRIAAVGAAVNIPANAEKIDGKGFSV